MELFAYFIPLILSVFVFGIIVLNDGNFLDGWYVQGWIKRKDWQTLKKFTTEVGLPYLYKFYRAIYFIQPQKKGFNFLNLIALLGTSYLCAYISYATGYFNKSESILIACLVLSYPGNQLVSEKCLGQYFVGPFLFYSAVALNCFPPKMSSDLYVVTTSISIFLFWLAFHMNSTLVFYFCFIFLKSIYLFQNKNFNQYYNIFEYTLLFLLPFIFWYLKEKTSPRHGFYKEYNKISFRSKRIILGLKSLLCEGSLGCYVYSLRWILQNPLILILVCILSFVFASFVQLPVSNKSKDTLLILGVCLLILAALPYILVGQPFGNFGWATKNNTLLSFPSALIIFSIVELFVQKENQIEILLFIILYCSIFLAAVNLSWIAMWAKNKSVLQKSDALKETSIIEVQDLYPTVLCNNNTPEWWNISLTYMFCSARPKIDKFCIFKKPDDQQKIFSKKDIQNLIYATTVPYCLKDIKKTGQRAKISIYKGDHCFGDFRIAVKYLFYSIFLPKKLQKFLRKLVNLKIKKIAALK